MQRERSERKEKREKRKRQRKRREGSSLRHIYAEKKNPLFFQPQRSNNRLVGQQRGVMDLLQLLRPRLSCPVSCSPLLFTLKLTFCSPPSPVLPPFPLWSALFLSDPFLELKNQYCGWPPIPFFLSILCSTGLVRPFFFRSFAIAGSSSR